MQFPVGSHPVYEAGPVVKGRAVLFDVDGTLIDALAGQQRIWHEWAARFQLDPVLVYETALRTRPVDTATELLAEEDRAAAVALFNRLEDAEAVSGDIRSIDGASKLLATLTGRKWALVTSNAAHRVSRRFERLGLPLPTVIVDNAATDVGKPHPDPYLLAARLLKVQPSECLVIEDSASGVTAGLAAGMTVWSVNGTVPVIGAHRHYRALSDAAVDIVDFITTQGLD
jgi:mannitol-1-/sugar-/sorbitol-6-phosphatase